METYTHLRIDAGDLAEALSGRLDEGAWMVDLESGEVIMAAPESVTGEPEDEDWEDPERFLAVEPMDSRLAFEIMDDFVADLPEGEPSRALARALRMRGPFRCFKDTLLEFPDLREQWFRYHDGRMLEYAQEWLEESLPGAILAVPGWLRRKVSEPAD